MKNLIILRKISLAVMTAVIVLLVFLIAWFSFHGANDGLPMYISEQYMWSDRQGNLSLLYGKPKGCVYSVSGYTNTGSDPTVMVFAGKYDYDGNSAALEEAGLYKYYDAKKGCIYVSPETLKSDTQFMWNHVMTEGEETHNDVNLDLEKLKPEGPFDKEYGVDWHMDNTGSVRLYLDPQKSGRVTALRIIMIHDKNNAALIGDPLLFEGYPEYDAQSETSGYTYRKGSEQTRVHFQLSFHEDGFDPDEYRDILEALHLYEPLQKGYLDAKEDIAENPDFLYYPFIQEADLQTNISFLGLPAYDVHDFK